MTCSSRRLAAFLAWSLGVLVATGPAALAQTAEKDRARALFLAGARLFGEGQYEAALERYRAARLAYPSYKIDLNIATALHALKRNTEAAEHFERFLAQAGKAAPLDIAASAQEALQQLRATLGRITVVCPAERAEVEVDRKSVGFTPLALPIYVEPGTHQVQVTKQGTPPYVVEIALQAGEEKTVQVPWSAPSTGASAAASAAAKPAVAASMPASATQPAAAPLISPRPAPTRPPSRWKRIAGWTAVGTGAATLVAGIVLGALAKGKASDYQAGVDAGAPYEELDAIDESGKTLDAAAIGTLVAGGVLAIAGGGLLLWDRLGARGEQGPSARVGWAPLVGGSTFGVMAAGRF